MYVKDEFKLLAIYPDDFDYEIFYFEKLMKDGIFFDNNIICVGLASHPSYIELEGVVIIPQTNESNTPIY